MTKCMGLMTRLKMSDVLLSRKDGRPRIQCSVHYIVPITCYNALEHVHCVIRGAHALVSALSYSIVSMRGSGRFSRII